MRLEELAITHHAAIELHSYSPAWRGRFDAEHNVLTAIFPAPGFCIEHIGSTSVPGLAAKPIIDILLGAPALAQIEARIPRMQALGYQYLPEYEAVLPQRRYFVKPMARPRKFHFHAVELESAFWSEHLLFRDTLRSEPDVAARYAALKYELAARYGDDRDRYADAKAPFIRSVIERATARLKLTADPH
jgi:GrpB-like predicted nucleotidyltransferase (UPF0157 family)